MKLCYICDQNKPSFFFPKDISESQAWCTILECPLPNKIGAGGEKLCQSHFNDYDIYTNSRGARRLKKGAKPLKLYQDNDKDDTVYLVSREHIKIGANKSLLASSSKYMKDMLSSSYYQIVDTTIYLPDTSHYIIKCFLDVLYSYGEVLMIDIQYKEKMKEFLALIQCNVLLVEENDDNTDDDEEEEDSIDEEEEKSDNVSNNNNDEEYEYENEDDSTP